MTYCIFKFLYQIYLKIMSKLFNKNIHFSWSRQRCVLREDIPLWHISECYNRYMDIKIEKKAISHTPPDTKLYVGLHLNHNIHNLGCTDPTGMALCPNNFL